MMHIKSFAEFIGETSTGYTPKEKKEEPIPDFCPTCGANLKNKKCDYCGNTYTPK